MHDFRRETAAVDWGIPAFAGMNGVFLRGRRFRGVSPEWG